MDVSGFEHEALTWLAMVAASLVILALKRLYGWLGLKLSTDLQAAFNTAVEKVLMFGVTQAEGVIAEKGWNHAETKSAVINTALQALPSKFPDALKGIGLDPDNPADQPKIVDAMTRMIPEVFAKAAASPATPPTAAPPASAQPAAA